MRKYIIEQQEFDRAVQAERARQIEKGYDAAHDDEHGVAHLTHWRDVYKRRGRVIAAAAIDVAISEHLARVHTNGSAGR